MTLVKPNCLQFVLNQCSTRSEIEAYAKHVDVQVAEFDIRPVDLVTPATCIVFE